MEENDRRKGAKKGKGKKEKKKDITNEGLSICVRVRKRDLLDFRIGCVRKNINDGSLIIINKNFFFLKKNVKWRECEKGGGGE